MDDNVTAVTAPPRGRDTVLRAVAEVCHADLRLHPRGSALRYAAPRDVAPEPLPSELARLLAALRASVAVYVCNCRRAGAPIWRVLPDVKALVRESVGGSQSDDTLAPLLTTVVGWTIAAYYDGCDDGARGREAVGVPGAA